MGVCFCIVSCVCGLGMFSVCSLLRGCGMGISLVALVSASHLVMGVGIIGHWWDCGCGIGVYVV